jgi:hypothetical protein
VRRAGPRRTLLRQLVPSSSFVQLQI